MEREEMEGLEQTARYQSSGYTIAAILFVFVGSRLARLGMPTGLYHRVRGPDNRAPIVLAEDEASSIVPTFCLKSPGCQDSPYSHDQGDDHCGCLRGLNCPYHLKIPLDRCAHRR